MSDTTKILEKAQKYLSNGNVTIEEFVSHPPHAKIIVVGSVPDSPYTVWYADGWICDCPARVKCAHIVAAELISDFVEAVPEKRKYDINKELDELLGT